MGCIRQYTENGDDGSHRLHSQSPYHFMMEDEYSSTDSMISRYLQILCIKRGSLGYPAHNWMEAFHDGRQELMEHFRNYWSDIMDDEESNRLEWFLLILECPMALLRKVCMVSLVLHVGMEIYSFRCSLQFITHFICFIPLPPFCSSLYQFHAKAHTAGHLLHYQSHYQPSGWVCTS